MALFVEDAALSSDHGGKALAARNVVRLPPHLARFLLGLRQQAPPDFTVRPCRINGLPGLLAHEGHVLASALTIEVAAGRIQVAYAWRNPDTLRTLARTG